MMLLSFRWRVDWNRCRMRIGRKLMELVLGEQGDHCSTPPGARSRYDRRLTNGRFRIS
jgi:hypothetical protein